VNTRVAEMTLEERLERIESMLTALMDRQVSKDWYSTAEVGKILGLSGYTVREWARNGRIRASKRACGRGRSKEWLVARDEVNRIRNEGLLPAKRGA
jgi:excisionase family DNA binding protein